MTKLLYPFTYLKNWRVHIFVTISLLRCSAMAACHASAAIPGGATIPCCSLDRSLTNITIYRLRQTLSPQFYSKPPTLCFSTKAMLKRSPKRLKYAAPRLSKGDDMLYVEVDPLCADSWKLEPIIQLLKDGAVGVIPTDTVYAIVCDLKNYEAIERLRRINEIATSKPLSILCHSLRDIDTYTMGFPRGNGHGQTNIFRAVKHCLPGPYTFILPASKALPRQCIKHGNTTKYASRKTVGVRMPDDAICQAILEKLESPLLTTSVKWPTKDTWMVDPVIIADTYEPQGIDFVLDGGVRVADPSTVVDMTGSSPTIIRQGKGPKHDWMISIDEEGSPTACQNEVFIPRLA